MKRHTLLFIISTILIAGFLSVAYFNYDDKIASAAVTKASKQVITAKQIGLVKKNPNTYKGYPIQITARVVAAKVAGQKGYTTFQALLDPQGQKVNSIISIKGSTVVKNGQNIKLQGIITGQKAGDAKLKLVRIIASKIEKVSAVNPAAPAVTTIIPVGTAIQQGVEISIPKIELTSGETRINLKIKNGSSSKVRFDYSNAKMIQGTKQYDRQTRGGGSYSLPQGDLLPGIETQGILVFGTINRALGDIKIYLEGSFEQSGKTFTPMYITVSWSEGGKATVSYQEEKSENTTPEVYTDPGLGKKSAEELKKQSVPMGQTFTSDEGFEISTDSCLQGTDAEMYLTNGAVITSDWDWKYVIINLSVKNVNSKQQAATISRNDFSLIGSSGEIFDPLKNTLISYNCRLKPLFASLEHGESIIGSLDFILPENECKLYLIWDPDQDGRNQKYFEVH
ncbi:MAG: hypothetical protein ACM3MK_01860 [Chitinophagales bacterium]